MYSVPGTVFKPFPCSEFVLVPGRALSGSQSVQLGADLAHKYYSARPEPLRMTWRNI